MKIQTPQEEMMELDVTYNGVAHKLLHKDDTIGTCILENANGARFVADLSKVSEGSSAPEEVEEDTSEEYDDDDYE